MIQDDYYYGYYKVGEEKFKSKLFAAIKSTETNQPMTWHYHDDLFAAVKPTGNISLKELYKQRAQQLRDKYDYLILYYSGGSDSWTVLNTFLENNIKIDHLVVRWPMSALNKGIYVPNNVNRSATNTLSEWDFTIKRDLEYITKNYPNIKIEVVDWLENVSTDIFNDSILERTLGYATMSALLRVNKGTSPTEIKLVEQGKKVGTIYGIDKPYLISHNNKVYFYFHDGAICICQPRPENPYGTEYFYWTPDMPQLVVEQAYQIYLYYTRNPNFSNVIHSSKYRQWDNQTLQTYELSVDVSKSIIYPDWDNSKFQAHKSKFIEGFEGRERDYRIEVHPELASIKSAWRHYWISYIDKIDPKLLTTNKDFKLSLTKFHYLGNI